MIEDTFTPPLYAQGEESTVRNNLETVLTNAKLLENSFQEALLELLCALLWNGTAKELIAALPSTIKLDLEATRDVLARIGYETEVTKASATPAISAPVIHISKDQKVTCLHPYESLPNRGLLLHVFEPVNPVAPPPQISWTSWTISSMWPQLMGALFASLMINLAGLALPFFTRYVYDRAIPAQSHEVLFYLGGGVLIVVLFGILFRNLRSRLLTYAGGRIAYLAGVESLDKILSLPLPVLVKSSTDAHILRLRDLERIRELVSGRFAMTILDAPFIIIFLIAIGYLGGFLVVVPIVSLTIYMLFIPLMSMAEDRAMRSASRLNAERSAMQQDMVDKLKDLIGVGLEERWIEKYSRVMLQSAAANRKFALVSSALRAFSRFGSSLTALAVLGTGIWLIFQGTITPGALIASMMLIWKVITPAQSFATSLGRYFQLKHSCEQLQRLMDLQGESYEASLVSPLRGLAPTVAVSRVVFRHSANREPSLAGVSFQVNEGEIIGITGPNGAGKTTLLHVIAGLIQPQGGSVLIGGRDIRQFRTEDLRSWLGLMPEHDKPFRGTLRSNLLMGRSDATDEELQQALEEAGLANLVDELPYGFESFMYRENGLCVGHDQQQSICIARALLKQPSLLLFDDPTFHSEKFREHFLCFLNKSRGKRTILFTSHEKRLLEQCDKVLVMDQGMPIGFDKIAVPSAS